ncbi:MAG: response regulator transcription factor [Selenomonadaceae bacterium]|nr:response regulator transcription factor [Selenomonadaceae bacterium]
MKKVLIIEDDEKITEIERDYLEANDFEVELAANGTEGLEKSLANDYDLILLDIMLPGVDGFQICRNIRKVKETPILLVSAKREDVDKIRGLGLGADDYIVKPFSPSELVARVKSHIARYERLTGGKNQANILNFDDLVINLDAHRVFVGGNEVTLANREFELLVFLAQNPNIVFSRERLFERIWGLDALGDSATVTVHVNRIRDKIEHNPNKPRHIETIWGSGYRFNAI